MFSCAFHVWDTVDCFVCMQVMGKSLYVCCDQESRFKKHHDLYCRQNGQKDNKK